MDATSIQTAIDGLKVAMDIAKAMVDIRDTATLQSKPIDLQRVILEALANASTAYSEQSSMLDRIRQLEEEVACMKAWDAEKQRYKLHEVRQGAFTYILKEEAGPSEPVHQLCANCYTVHNRKSILQLNRYAAGRTRVLMCPSCETDIFIEGARR